MNIARSSNGRTSPSGGGYLGSNPGLAADFKFFARPVGHYGE